MKAPTAEQLIGRLRRYYPNEAVSELPPNAVLTGYDDAIAAIEAHTAAHTKKLRERIAKLESGEALGVELVENLVLTKRVKELEAILMPIANTHDVAIEIDPKGIAHKMRNAAANVLKRR